MFTQWLGIYCCFCLALITLQQAVEGPLNRSAFVGEEVVFSCRVRSRLVSCPWKKQSIDAFEEIITGIFDEDENKDAWECQLRVTAHETDNGSEYRCYPEIFVYDMDSINNSTTIRSNPGVLVVLPRSDEVFHDYNITILTVSLGCILPLVIMSLAVVAVLLWKRRRKAPREDGSQIEEPKQEPSADNADSIPKKKLPAVLMDNPSYFHDFSLDGQAVAPYSLRSEVAAPPPPPCQRFVEHQEAEMIPFYATTALTHHIYCEPHIYENVFIKATIYANDSQMPVDNSPPPLPSSPPSEDSFSSDCTNQSLSTRCSTPERRDFNFE